MRTGTLLIFAALAVPEGAAAQGHTVQGVVQTTAGATSNPNLANVDADIESPDVSTFFSISPGIIYSYQARSAVHLLTYNFNASVFTGAQDANAYTNALNYNGAFVISGRTRGTLLAAVSHGQSNNIVRQQQAGQPGGDAQQAGGTTFLTTNVGQGLEHEFGDNWVGTQSAAAAYFKVLEAENAPTADTLTVGGSVAAEKRFARWGAGARFNVIFSSIGDAEADNGMVGNPGGDQLIFGPELFYRRDLTPRWNTQLALGLSGVTRTDAFDESGLIIQPTGAASLGFTEEGYSAGLGYTRTIQPNLQVGQVLLSDAVFLNGGLPLSRRNRVVMAATLAYQRIRALNANLPMMADQVAPASDIFQANIGPAWEINDNLNLTLGYQFQRQNAAAGVGLADFTVHNGFVSIAGRYPAVARPVGRLFQSSGRLDAADGFRDERSANPE